MGGRGSSSGAKGGMKISVSSSKQYDESYSRFSKIHAETVEHIKRVTGVDLNKYRSEGTDSPFNTAYWDKNGFKVAFDLKGMNENDRRNLLDFSQKGSLGEKASLIIEEGGAWIGYAYFKK